jgi:predicted acyltransferase
VNVVIGYYTGLYVQERKPNSLSMLLRAGCALVILACIWNTVFPVNKKLWTSSFVLLTSGLDLIILTFLLYIIDVKGSTRWTPFFTVFGKNPLFLYLLSEVVVIFLNFFTIGQETVYGWLNSHIFQPVAPGKVGSLLFAVVYMLFCWSVGKILDKKRIYVRV